MRNPSFRQASVLEAFELRDSREFRECGELPESFDSMRLGLVSTFAWTLSAVLLAVVSDPVIGPG